MTSILAESLGILWSGGRGKQKNKNKEQNGGDKWEIVYWGGGAFRGRAELVKLVFAAADVKYTMQGDGIPEIIAAYPKEPTPVATRDTACSAESFTEIRSSSAARTASSK